MEILNNIILFGIFLSSLVNLVIELDEKKTVKYVVIAKGIFASMAIGSLLAAIYAHVGFFLVLNLSVLIGLILRIISRTTNNKSH